MKRIITIAVLTSLCILGYAEGNDDKKPLMQSLSYKVVDANNESISGAKISIENFGLVTYTDLDGNFQIEVPADSDSELKISFISYQDKVVATKNIAEGKIVLSEE